jgi:hypothetical protein
MRRARGRTDLGRGPEKWRCTVLLCFFSDLGLVVLNGFRFYLFGFFEFLEI